MNEVHIKECGDYETRNDFCAAYGICTGIWNCISGTDNETKNDFCAALIEYKELY